MEAPLIEARALDKSFGPTPILRGLNFRVAAAHAALIIGQNGAGKSTLVRILAGLSTPSAGDALLFGYPSATLAPDLRARLGVMTHQSFLYPNLTARENLEFYADLYRLKLAQADIAGWLGRVGLAAAADDRVGSFSRGMEQRLSLARALMPTPDVLLMDEPFTALDGEGADLAAALLKRALERGCALVLTAHEPLLTDWNNLTLYELRRGRLFALTPDAAERRPLRAG